MSILPTDGLEVAILGCRTDRDGDSVGETRAVFGDDLSHSKNGQGANDTTRGLRRVMYEVW